MPADDTSKEGATSLRIYQVSEPAFKTPRLQLLYKDATDQDGDNVTYERSLYKMSITSPPVAALKLHNPFLDATEDNVLRYHSTPDSQESALKTSVADGINVGNLLDEMNELAILDWDSQTGDYVHDPTSAKYGFSMGIVGGLKLAILQRGVDEITGHEMLRILRMSAQGVRKQQRLALKVHGEDPTLLPSLQPFDLIQATTRINEVFNGTKTWNEIAS